MVSPKTLSLTIASLYKDISSFLFRDIKMLSMSAGRKTIAFSLSIPSVSRMFRVAWLLNTILPSEFTSRTGLGFSCGNEARCLV